MLNVKDVLSEAKNAFVDDEEVYETPMKVFQLKWNNNHENN